MDCKRKLFNIKISFTKPSLTKYLYRAEKGNRGKQQIKIITMNTLPSLSNFNDFKSDFSSIDETSSDKIIEKINEYFINLKTCNKEIFNLKVFKKFLSDNLIVDGTMEDDLEISNRERLKLFDSIKKEGDIFNCKYSILGYIRFYYYFLLMIFIYS